MSRLRFSVLAFVLIWAGSFLACSKSTPTTSPNSAKSAAAPAASTSSALPHPCTLLTAKDAKEVFGAGAQLKRHSDTTCMIEGADPLPDGLISVTITLIDPKDWDASKKNVFATFPEAKFVSGIGEDGYTFSEGIAFHKGKVFVIVSTSGYLGPKPKAEIAKHLAEQVAAHL